jgi:hypothetical protein
LLCLETSASSRSISLKSMIWFANSDSYTRIVHWVFNLVFSTPPGFAFPGGICGEQSNNQKSVGIMILAGLLQDVL